MTPSFRCPPVETSFLYPFRYRNSRSGRWINARYKATREEIAGRYAEWEIIGPAEIRKGGGGAFNPFRVIPHSTLTQLEEPAPQIDPHLMDPPTVDALECHLALIFLRRYVTYCARRRSYAQMQGAARLHRAIAVVHERLQ